MTIVFKVSDNLKPRIIEYYKDLKKDKTPPYAIFQALSEDTTITLYESGKIMFQGTSADIDANIWIDLEKKFNKRIINLDGSEKKHDERNEEQFHFNTIGSDEVGTGDFFGPIVVTASYVEVKDFEYLKKLGVKDSKKLNDDIILKIAPELIKNIPHVTTIIDNTTYNNNYKKEMNMNKIKAILHNKAIFTLKNKYKCNYGKIIIDEFCSKENYYKYLDKVNDVVKYITFMTKAEDKILSVAVSSIISRYIFLKKMEELSNELGINLPKGASNEVNSTAKDIIKKFNIEKLKEIAKLNFKNMEKIVEK